MGLRHFGDKRSADYLDDWKRGPGDELEGRIQLVLRDERLAAFRKLVDLLLRLDPDKKPPTISLDDSFLWLLDRRYLGRWWATCRDDLGLDDKVVYKDCKSKIEPCRYGQVHGRPPDLYQLEHIPPKDCKPKIKSSRRGRAHGRPPDLNLAEHFPDQHDTSATSSRVLTGSKGPETMNVESMRQHFFTALCSSSVLESAPTKPTDHNGTSEPHPRVSPGGCPVAAATQPPRA